MKNVKNLWRRFVIALLLLAFFFLTFFFIGEVASHKIEENAVAINVSGRQRMLSQRIAMFANKYVQLPEEYKAAQKIPLVEARDLFLKSHKALLYGDNTMDLSGRAGDIAAQIYFEEPHKLNEQVSDYLGYVDALLQTGDLKEQLEILALMNEMAEGRLLESLDQVVKTIEIHDKESIQNIILIRRISFALAILLLLLEARYIFWPAQRYVQEAFEERLRSEEEKEKFIKQLVDSNESLEKFAHASSHDLQEPLRMIVTFSELLKTRHEAELGEKALKYLNIIHESSQRMVLLVQDLLEYSRLGSEAEKFVTVNMNNILKNVQENLFESIKRLDALIIADELPILIGNPVRLSRVLQNLVGNAIKYQPEGNRPEIHIRVVEEDNSWLFSVGDNGIGIKEEYREKIFEPFKRLHTYSEYQGTGMGLPICKRIIEDLNGKMEVMQANEGQGNIFTFTIPKVTQAGNISL